MISSFKDESYFGIHSSLGPLRKTRCLTLTTNEILNKLKETVPRTWNNGLPTSDEEAVEGEEMDSQSSSEKEMDDLDPLEIGSAGLIAGYGW